MEDRTKIDPKLAQAELTDYVDEKEASAANSNQEKLADKDTEGEVE